VSPVLATTRAALAAARARLPRPVVLVPTMGALHSGHRALLRRARELSSPDGSLMVSIFVNPLQFGPGEDFDRYPRSLEQDLAICAEEGADVLFAPDQAEIYPGEQLVRVDPGQMGQVLEGRSRPGFLPGMLTVVMKLFQLTAPDVAVFGAKDAQQLALVRRMTADLDLGVVIADAAIVRDADGLASSSRNAYLSVRERATALALPRALTAGAAAARGGPPAVRAAALAVLDAAAVANPPLVPDYLALVVPETFQEVPDDASGAALLLVAAKIGTTRLIDNTAVMLRARADGRGAQPAARRRVQWS
jgi:pantoate--beta-alanine ligase